MQKRKREVIEKTSIGVREKLKQIIEEKESVDFCNIELFKYKSLEEENDNKLVFLASYLNYDVRLYIWNPLLENEETNKLNKLFHAYQYHVVPMMDEEISVFFIPFVASSNCTGNLVEIIKEKLKGDESQRMKIEGEQSKILILNNFSETERQYIFNYDYLGSFNQRNYLKVLFLIYWTIEACQRRGFHFNFKDYRSIKIMILPKEKKFIFFLNDNLFYLYTKYIPLIDLYYCNLDEEFDIEFFENYINIFKKYEMEFARKLLFKIGQEEEETHEGETMNISKLAHEKVIEEIKEKPITGKKENIITKLNKLIVKRYLSQREMFQFENSYPSVFKLNRYAMEELTRVIHPIQYFENIMYIDKQTIMHYSLTPLSSLKINNSLGEFVNEILYSQFFSAWIEEEEKPMLFKFLTFGKIWILASQSRLTYREEYIFDFNDKTSYLGRGSYGTVWVTCRRKGDKTIYFDPDCKYAAKFIKIKSKEDREKFEEEYNIAKKMSEQKLTVEILDHYIVHGVIEFENLEELSYGVIIMERWPMTLWEYVQSTDSEEYKKYRKEIKNKWVDLYLRLYDLGYKIPDMHFSNTMIRFEHGTPELTLIDFGLAREIDDREVAKELFEKTFNIEELHPISKRSPKPTVPIKK